MDKKILRQILRERKYEDKKEFFKNTMPPRCYYIPSGVSERVSLNGVWKFSYFSSIEEVKEPEATIPVPSNWQIFGYDIPQYHNLLYPIPFRPPCVPRRNPCGLYRRTFFLAWRKDRKYSLRFEGVDSFYYVCVNDRLVGWQSVSHCPGEFDVTSFVKDGQNTLEVLVLKWCCGTYFEDQDKFRMSGIFRDVDLLARPSNVVYDCRVSPFVADDLESARLELKFVKAEGETNIGLFFEKKEVCRVRTVSDSAVLYIPSPVLWNAEIPKLYRIRIEQGGEVIAFDYALRKAEIKNGVFYLNGKKVKLFGINRHESSYESGFALSREQTLRDLRLLKSLNVNAIRCSHYPAAPYFYQLADKLGFYVIDEADLETHGVIWKDGDNDVAKNFSFFSDDPAYGDMISERIRRVVARDYNFGCILFWSLGNESGWGKNLAQAAEWVRECDASRLVHYESTYINGEKKEAEEFPALDMESKMYPSSEAVRKYLGKKSGRKPLFLCEFGHAMGNGPGGLEKYIDLFRREERCVGGCVWEFNDHAVKGDYRTPSGKTYKNVPLFGGDFGEKMDSGNFCVDGLVDYKRRPKSGFYEYANLIKPLAVVKRNDEFIFQNRFFFHSVGKGDFIKITYAFQDGTEKETRLAMPLLCAGEECALKIPEKTEDVAVTFSYYMKGRCVGLDCLDLTKKGKGENSVVTGKAMLEENNGHIVFRGKNFCYRLDPERLSFVQLNRDGVEFLSKPSRFLLARAYTDNDLPMKEHWQKIGVEDFTVRVFGLSAENGCCRARFSLEVKHFIPLGKGKFEWTVGEKGDFFIRLEFFPSPHTKWLPRFALELPLRRRFASVFYDGYGPGEGYADKMNSLRWGRFSFSADKEKCPYLKPQEYGLRWQCRRVSIESAFSVFAEEPFSFSFLPYSVEQLARTRHVFELRKETENYLILDVFHSGLGSGSCGPLPDKEFVLSKRIAKSLMFKF